VVLDNRCLLALVIICVQKEKKRKHGSAGNFIEKVSVHILNPVLLSQNEIL
jgi:hypothetical protein